MPDQHAGPELGLAIFLEAGPLLLTDAFPTKQGPTIGRAPTSKNSESVYYYDKEEQRSPWPVTLALAAFTPPVIGQVANSGMKRVLPIG
jgi:hypothetical protein